METTNKNLQQKLVEVRKKITSFTKDAQAGEGRYEYVSGSQVLKAIKEEMDAQGIILQPELVSESITLTQGTKKTKYGENRTFTLTGMMKYIWHNADDPKDTLITNWYLAGEQDDPSKAYGSALTYAERYFLLKFFGIPTDDDDPDAKKPEKPAAENKTYNKPTYQARTTPTTTTAIPSSYGEARLATQSQIDYLESLIAKTGELPDFFYQAKGIEDPKKLKFTDVSKLIDELK
jgi:hypothetical protein